MGLQGQEPRVIHVLYQAHIEWTLLSNCGDLDKDHAARLDLKAVHFLWFNLFDVWATKCRADLTLNLAEDLFVAFDDRSYVDGCVDDLSFGLFLHSNDFANLLEVLPLVHLDLFVYLGCQFLDRGLLLGQLGERLLCMCCQSEKGGRVSAFQIFRRKDALLKMGAPLRHHQASLLTFRGRQGRHISLV